MNALLHCSGISKTFPGVKALRHVDFEVNLGEVHALAGENGAGKTTLMHILAGACKPDEGTISFNGIESIKIRDEHHARQIGIAIVYQERSLFDLMSVAENIFVNQQPVNRAGAIDRKKLNAEARQLLRQVGLDVDPAMSLGDLPPAQQQMVEIAKALSIDSRLLILDEPTAALTFGETRTLFGIIRGLKERGAGIIYISHRLEEIFEIADRVTVLKDGTVQGTWPVRETTPQQLVSKMVGREHLFERVDRPVLRRDTARLTIKHLSDNFLKDVNLSAYAGEIIGFAGLAGAGRTELAMSIFGARPFNSGEVLVDGKPVRIASPEDAMAAGIGYLPEDRKSLGLFLEMSVAQNIAAARLGYFGGKLIHRTRVLDAAHQFTSRLQIVPSDPERSVRTLSGGNQQKVLFARWLLREPRILIVDEPTRGVDVGAKAGIYDVLRALANEGKLIIAISSDLPEILTISDRIYVMREGRIAAEISGAEASEEEIMRYAATSQGETNS